MLASQARRRGFESHHPLHERETSTCLPFSPAILLARYALVARAQGLSPKTINHTTRSVRFFHTFLGDPKDIRSIQADDLRRFIIADQQRDRWPGRARRLQKLSPTSINTYVRAIKGYWSWMKREGLVEHDSLKEVVPPKLAHRLPKTFSEEELKKVFAVVTNQPREKAMLSLFLDSGITLQEIIALKTSDLNLTEGNAHVFREKTARERYVYFSPPTALNIERYLLQRPEHWQDDHLFLTRDGQPLQPHRVQEILVRVGRKAGLTQRLSPHKLRHTFATLSLKYGSNLEYIRIQLGHSDIKTTSKFYLHASNSDVRQSHQKSSPVTNLGLRQPVIPTRDRNRSIHRARDEKPHP